MITTTIDDPSHYPNYKVPMLDVKVWLNSNDDNKIYYSFYEKPTKSQYVMSKVSAMPISKKIEYIGQEVFCRLHNTKREVSNDQKIEMMNLFMMKLKMSGYDDHDRY